MKALQDATEVVLCQVLFDIEQANAHPVFLLEKCFKLFSVWIYSILFKFGASVFNASLCLDKPLVDNVVEHLGRFGRNPVRNLFRLDSERAFVVPSKYHRI